VLSYKNHAIDEFLRDLINAENRKISLIRIGGSSKDKILEQYAERNQQSFRQVQ
jgi:predicted HAD superfamily phosphohydrolase